MLGIFASTFFTSCEVDDAESIVVGEFTEVQTSVFEGNCQIEWQEVPTATEYKITIDNADEPISQKKNKISLKMQTESADNQISLGDHKIKVEAFRNKDLIHAGTMDFSVIGNLKNISTYQDAVHLKVSWDTTSLVSTYKILVDGEVKEATINAGVALLNIGTHIKMGKHEISVQGLNSDKIQIMGAKVSAELAPIDIDSPKNLKSTVMNDSLVISWDAVAEADGYQLFINDKRAEEQKIYSVKVFGTKASIKRAAWEKNKAIDFKVAATQDNKEGLRSEAISFIPKAPAKPTNLFVEAGNGRLKYSWDWAADDSKVEAVKYQLKINGENKALLETKSDSTLNLPRGFYKVEVTAVSKLGIESYKSDIASTVIRKEMTPLDAPVNLRITKSGWGMFSSKNLQWDYKDSTDISFNIKHYKVTDTEEQELVEVRRVKQGETISSKPSLQNLFYGYKITMYNVLMMNVAGKYNEVRVYLVDKDGNELGYTYLDGFPLNN